MANGANILRDLFVRLGINVNPKNKRDLREFDKKVEEVKGHLEDVASAAITAAKWLGGLAVAGVAAATGLAVSTGQTATQIERQARALQLTRAEYQEVLAVFERFDGDASDVADALGTITDRTQDVLDGTQSVVDDFALIGLGVDQLRGKRPIELLETFADAVAGASDRNKALTAVVRILGDDLGAKITPALLDGAAGLRAMRMEAHELGLVMSDEQLRASKEAAEQWRKLTAVGRGLRNELGAALGPSVVRLVRGTLDWVRANRAWLSLRIEHGVRAVTTAVEAANAAVQLVGGWGVILANVATGAGMLLLLANLGKVEKALGAIRVVFAIVQTLFAASGLTLAAPFLPVLAVLGGLTFFVGLLGLAIQDLWVFWNGGKSVLGDNLDAIERVIPAFGAVRDLVGALAEAFIQAGYSVIGYARALRNGLRPALALIDVVLAPFVRRLERLWEIWQGLNKLPAKVLGRLASDIRASTDARASSSALGAMQLQSSLSGSVSRQVDRAALGVQQLDRALPGGPSTTINQSNTFLGGQGWEVDDALASASRKARASVAGGRR